MNILHTLSTCKQYVSVSIIVLAMTLFLAGCPSPNDPAVDPLAVGISTSGENNINEGGRISVTITSNQPVTDNLDVNLIIGGDATIDEDYELPGITTTTSGGTVTATVTISSGNTETMLTIDATDDSIHELNANLTITISDEPSTYRIKEGEKTVTVTITDDDLPTVGFRTTSQAQTLDEGDADSVTVTVERSNDEVRDPLTVQLSFEDSTATINADYALPGVTTNTLDDTVTATVTIPGESNEVTFTIDAIDDGFDETDETIIITINPSHNYELADASKSDTITIKNDSDVDDDDNGLIEIRNLDMLRNVHFNLAGTSYDDEEDDVSGNGATGSTNGAPASPTDHCKTLVDGDVYLCGYELTRNLDFSDAGSYATGIIKEEWRPNVADNSNNSTNEGFPGIGAKTGTSGGFTGIFEGNGYSISNLYMRNTATQGHTGLFRRTEAEAKIRNLGMTNVALYGGAEYDIVGGLVGNNRGDITASYATGTVYGGDGNDDVGGLVGYGRSGDITASYATADVDGGADNDNDIVGGLVGNNLLTSITASYATGTVDGGAGNSDTVGGLVGSNHNGPITASYATGTVDGGAGNSDTVGGLVGLNYGPITASYGFGTPSGGTVNSDGADKPTGVIMASDLTSTNAETEWNNADSNTLGAWDFGDTSQNPALKYADYDDDAGTTYSCGPVPACGDLLPGQRE